MCFGVRLVGEAAGVVAGVCPRGAARIQRLVRGLGVQDQVGHARGPRVRHSVFEPAQHNTHVNTERSSYLADKPGFTWK